MKQLITLILIGFSQLLMAQDGYKLWLQYAEVDNPKVVEQYKKYNTKVQLDTTTATGTVIHNELNLALGGMLAQQAVLSSEQPTLVILKYSALPQNLKKEFDELSELPEDGYKILTMRSDKRDVIVISSASEKGLLYGTFAYLREMQLHKDLSKLDITDASKIKKRLLNHWDNLDRTIERGYAGFSIWDWHLLPNLIKEEYIDYARANASIGINGTVLNNVNASAYILQDDYLQKVKALADAFRPYGIQVYLTARFSAPIEIGGLKTADPLNTEVQKWWNEKAKEIYELIPDFGGFLVKANSEGQPGPNNYGRSHVDGANMLADAVAPYGGIVMWRAFVYSDEKPEDRAKQAYSEFVPFDGKFKDNVLVQVKNGAIDFQPREPFHPLFGAMPETPLMMEFQITQEYLGGMSHLVFLPKLFEETLQGDTYAKGTGSTVAKVVDGSLNQKELTGMAGVSNIGNARNWTGHPFAQANWYGFGRLAWNPELSAKTIAQEWLGQTFTPNPEFVKPMTSLLLDSREAVVNYMTPLGLHHIMAEGHHQGPGPWVKDLGREDWTSVYYHKADSLGIGFDRTSSGSDALAQYAPEIEKAYEKIETTPQKYLLWFHHVPWDYKLENGQTLWYNLARKYQDGVEEVEAMINTWKDMKPYVGDQVYEKTRMLLSIQLEEAQWWRDSCLLYFQQFSNKKMLEFIPQAKNNLDYYESIRDPYAPGIKPSWD
ncbi:MULTISPECIES: alpha-glucuronidase family glycosyl hydrolase [unclassified Leeuwenhoekiella]|uniref:alpha-glucuronidase family glycosyl hydrolase n=2 Tax=Leeuwenhoekiella TaxID=283735 RepID=UPI000C51AE03|nr:MULTISPECIES: alpha-glucuronidase family glycosyl hydrolase [unclassified Leeuwenhoekiella]MAW93725.1 alpha-glucuronidase [Leeuwenhoekiella sp.]MBA83052.1 alpha-glucuronidase [Leeuwenhoekiella sp.]|tara:strand:- start:18847 stop:20997 length:2151 start_codon:yes stop_codon:yes gene_type:complete